MSFRGKWYIIVVPVLIVGIGVASLACAIFGFDSKSVIHRSDSLTKKAHDVYAQGSFDSAASALKKQIDYLELHQSQISPELRIEVTMQVAYARYANLLIWIGKIEKALPLFEKAYINHNLVLNNSSSPQLTREEFITYYFEWMNDLDRRTGAKWKTGLTLDTNKVDSLTRLFLRN